jgi:hypothetical protein
MVGVVVWRASLYSHRDGWLWSGYYSPSLKGLVVDAVAYRLGCCGVPGCIGLYIGLYSRAASQPWQVTLRLKVGALQRGLDACRLRRLAAVGPVCCPGGATSAGSWKEERPALVDWALALLDGRFRLGLLVSVRTGGSAHACAVGTFDEFKKSHYYAFFCIFANLNI